LGRSQDSIARTAIRARASGCLSDDSLPGVALAGSGSNPSRAEAPISGSQGLPDETVGRRCHILIVEDNQADAALIRRALARAGVSAELHELNDGEKAIRFFEKADADPQAPCPRLILLDINMPRYKGGEILRHLRASRRCRNALVLVVTSSDSQRDRQEMNSLGANGYFRKPSVFEEFMRLGPEVRQLLAIGDDPSAPSV
jgi:two-component system, chemotaxis family, response regulator Rcp1